MRDGRKACAACGTVYQYRHYQAEVEPSHSPCEGCKILMRILAESARQLAAEQAATPEPEQQIETMTLADIERRLRGGHISKADTRDHAKAAAGDRD
jgi:hypothetical protein